MGNEEAEALGLVQILEDLRISFVKKLHDSAKNLHFLESFDQ